MTGRPRLVPRIVTVDELPGPAPIAQLGTEPVPGRPDELYVNIGIVAGTPWTRQLNAIFNELTSQEGHTPPFGMEPIGEGRYRPVVQHRGRGRHRPAV